MAGFRPRSSRSTTQPTRDCVKGPAGAPWRTSFRRTLEHAAGPVRALCFAPRFGAQGLWGPRALSPGLRGRCFAVLCFLPAAVCTGPSAPGHPGTTSSRTPPPATVPPRHFAIQGSTVGAGAVGAGVIGKARLGNAPSGTGVRSSAVWTVGRSPGSGAGRHLVPGPAGRCLARARYRAAGASRMNFAAAGLVVWSMSRCWSQRGRARSLAAYREHLRPPRGLDGMKVLLPGNCLHKCRISRGASSGVRATMRKGRAPEHPDIWVPPTAL